MVEAKTINTSEKFINVRFHLSWQEYFNAERFLLRQKQLFAPEQLIGAMLLLACGAFWVAIGLKWFLPIIAIAGLIMLSTPFFRKMGLRRRWAREPLHHQEHIISFAKSRIHYLLGDFESDLPWTYFQSWIESPDGFLLITGENVFNLIPKRAFVNEDQIKNFRTQVATKLKPIT